MGEGIATEPKTRRRRVIERPRLTRLLDASQGRIKMLVAPAGYGKTTLARQWLEGKRAVWFTATPASVDVAALAAGLQAAVSDIVEGAGSALMERLPVSRPEAETDVLASMLAGDLHAWPREAWLAFDDYHAIAGAAASERFLEALILEAPLNVLVITRRRPGWASSRRILYGEISEVNREALAMTAAEAHELLDRSTADTAALVELAQGWPAVLGLAATSGVSPPDLVAAPHLFNFFADEVYRRLPSRSQRSFRELALYNVAGTKMALQLLQPNDADELIQVGLDSGFLTDSSDGELGMHPLLRGFLNRKMEAAGPEGTNSIVARAVRKLIQHGLWDEAFELIQRFDAHELIADLVAPSMPRLLAEGRTSTLRMWIEAAPLAVPIIRLTEAELALREGRYHEAETLALLAARDLDEPEPAARALLVAGRAAHVASREEQAAKHYGAAAATADSDELVRIAQFGELQAAMELETHDVPERLAALVSRSTLEPDERVILADRRLGVESRYGLPVDIANGRAARQLLRLVADPMVRTSFRNVFGYALAASAHFDEAVELTEEQMEDAERCRLDFVIPYGLIIRALVLAGRREYVGADELLGEAEERAHKAGDRTASHIAWGVKMRLYIAQTAFDLALSKNEIDADTTRSLRAELTACRALALAGVCDFAKARDLANSALESIGVEATIMAESARAITALRSGEHDDGVRHAQAALACAMRTGLVESFVSAYRGFPELIVSLLEQKTHHADIAHILGLVGDNVMAAPTPYTPEHSVMQLSPREKEVLALVAQGLTNPEIGRVLFISPVTVKVHVRHIFEKLGVKSRAAAALRAAQLGRPD
jgi:LuxR family transcriptional regulator, maltose regulon positive regulatory protein